MDHQVYKARKQAHQRPPKAVIVEPSRRKERKRGRKAALRDALRAIFERMFPRYRARKFSNHQKGAFGGERRAGTKLIRRMARRNLLTRPTRRAA